MDRSVTRADAIATEDATEPVEKPTWRPRLAAWWAGDDIEGDVESPAKPPWQHRFTAWWGGYELGRPRRRIEVADIPAHESVPQVRESRVSPAIECLNQVWGEGFSSPGDAEYCCNLVRPIGLTDKLSMLELGAGLGGPARAISKEFGVWITGMELDRTLAAAGMDLSVAAGMGRKVPISPFDPKTAEFPERKFDCVFSKQGFCQIADQRDLAQKIERTLKYGGHLLYTDFVAADGAKGRSSLQQWLDTEPKPLSLVTANESTDILIESGLDPRVARDISDEYAEMITTTWTRWQEIVETINQFANRDQLMRALAQEVELWTNRSEAIQRGALKVYSFHATKRTACKGMSD